MAKSSKATKGSKATSNTRGRVYNETDTIVWHTGDGARRTVSGLSVERVKNALAAANKGRAPTVAQYVAHFGPKVGADHKGSVPLPGRERQSGRTASLGILRWLETVGALAVRAKVAKPKAVQPASVEPASVEPATSEAASVEPATSE